MSGRYFRNFLLGYLTYFFINKYFPEKFIDDPKEKSPSAPDGIIKDPTIIPESVTGIRGGSFEIVKSVTKRIIKDRALRGGVAVFLFSSAAELYADRIILALMESVPNLIAIPGLSFSPKFLKYLNKTNDLYQSGKLDLSDLIKVLKDTDIPWRDKLLLFKYQTKILLSGLGRIERRHLIMTIASLILFYITNSTGVLFLFFEALRNITKQVPVDEDVINEFIIGMYKEYNAPLPEELAKKIINL